MSWTNWYHREANTKLKFYTGGKSIAKNGNLFEFYFSADEILNNYAVPDIAYNPAPWGGVPHQGIPSSSIYIGALGELGSDGLFT